MASTSNDQCRSERAIRDRSVESREPGHVREPPVACSVDEADAGERRRRGFAATRACLLGHAAAFCAVLPMSIPYSHHKALSSKHLLCSLPTPQHCLLL
ncbi:hypothetical protein BHE74_00031614 [Ensete ventricosum]|nr:hypothetical protein GW17_00041871 [Ensete ventricosum]RWW61331.1 hypothetical protein BHE74_00031614 [Ensete ventricosum]RZS20829.1 hypothetical protein BHM03_00053399 [Ensete ventricosum]